MTTAAANSLLLLSVLLLVAAPAAAALSPFALFTDNDLAAFRINSTCAAALATPLNCDRDAVFGNYASLAAPAALAAFCSATGPCQRSLQAFAAAVQRGCADTVMLGPSASTASILRRLLLS